MCAYYTVCVYTQNQYLFNLVKITDRLVIASALK